MIRRLNEIRRENPALQQLSQRRASSRPSNDALVAYAKQAPRQHGDRRRQPRPAQRAGGRRDDPGAARAAAGVRGRGPAHRRALRLAHRAQLRRASTRYAASSSHLLQGRSRWPPAPGTTRATGSRPSRCGSRRRSSTRSTSRGFFDANGDGSGDFRGLTEKLDYLQWLGRRLHLAAAVLQVAAARRRLRHRRLLRDPARLRHGRRRPRLHRGRPPARHPRDRRPRHEPHVVRPPVVPGVALEPGQPQARLVRLVGHGPTATRTRGSSSPTPRRRTGPGTTRRGAYFWHRFFSHQPDLNFDNPEVQEAMLEVAALLARPRAWTASASTPCPTSTSATAPTARTCPRRTPTSSACARRSTPNYPDRVLLAEANQWPADVVEYFGDGDECHMAFHFPVMPRMFMARAPRGGRRRSTRSSTRRRRSRTTASGACSCATTTS